MLGVKSMVINSAVGTELRGDYPLSDDKVSKQMDAQIKPSAAVGLQHAEVCWLPPIRSCGLGKKRRVTINTERRNDTK